VTGARCVLLRLVLLSGLLVSGCAVARTCETDNAALQQMLPGKVSLQRADGVTVTFPVKIANNNRTRAAGFQRVCESTIEEIPILFLFDRAVVPSFHMNRVVAPIEIAFISADGSIDSIHHMQPYVQGSQRRPLYSSKAPIIAALETGRKFYQEHEVSLSDKISWQFLPSPDQ